MPLDSLPQNTELEAPAAEKDCYDLQIDAIMAGDWRAFSDLVGGDIFAEAVSSKINLVFAWALSANIPNSLFANLPNCNHCASQVEQHLDARLLSDDYYRDLFGGDVKLTQWAEFGGSPTSSRDITREELRPALEEFARRQRLARAHPFHLRETINAA